MLLWPVMILVSNCYLVRATPTGGVQSALPLGPPAPDTRIPGAASRYFSFDIDISF